jgi:hypothetical protein
MSRAWSGPYYDGSTLLDDDTTIVCRYLKGFHVPVQAILHIRHGLLYEHCIRNKDHNRDTEADDRQLVLPDNLVHFLHLCAKNV